MKFATKRFFCDVKYDEYNNCTCNIDTSQIAFVHTNNVFYSSSAVACYEVGIKRDHRHSTILSLQINIINVIHVVIVFFFSIVKCIIKKYVLASHMYKIMTYIICCHMQNLFVRDYRGYREKKNSIKLVLSFLKNIM